MNLFPAGLETSLFPAILIGVLLTFAATETLGWTFTGLVVPGYLGTVALVSPPAAALMTGEALATLAVVRLLSDGADRLGIGSRFFGRERFFLTLATATGIRLLTERLLLPGLAAPLGGGAPDPTGLGAHSIGLVLVPLLAHTFDRVGAVRGLFQMGVLTSATAALVAALASATDLTLADLSIVFEDVAFAIDHTPAAYAVLLFGAMLAARANVSYGWDFHGIIVPGLLAVAWFTPLKLLVTLVEALAALALAKLALRLPGLRLRQIEGPRRLVLVFCADAVLRLAAVVAGRRAAPDLSGSEFYGFGYLLPTLLAVTMFARHATARVLLPATQVSLGGFLGGNLVVVAASGLIAWLAPASPPARPPSAAPRAFEEAILLARSSVARTSPSPVLTAAERDGWRAAVARLAAGGPAEPALATLVRVGMSLSPLADGRGVVAREAPTSPGDLRGLGTVVVRGEGRRLAIAVPRPLDGDALVAAADVTATLDARVVVVAGLPDARAGLPGAARIGGTPYTLAERGLTAAGWGWLELVADEASPAEGELRLAPGAAAAPDLPALERLLPGLRVAWSPRGPTQLAAPGATWRALAARSCAERATRPAAVGLPGLIAPPRTGAPGRAPAPRDPELELAFAETVVGPLVAGALRGDPGAAIAACRPADVLGFQVLTLQDGTGARHLAVVPGAERASTVLVRVRPRRVDEPQVVAPRAAAEPHAAGAALALYNALEGRALVIHRARDAGAGGLGEAASEALASATGDATLVLEVRGGGEGLDPLDEGAILAWGGVPGDPGRPPAWLGPLERAAERTGLGARRYEGRADQACCGDLHNARRARLARLGRGRLATLYLSAALRQARFGADGIEGARALAIELGLPRAEAALPRLVEEAIRAAPTAATDGEAADLYRRARRWAELRHVGDLRALVGQPGVLVALDPDTGEAFLLIALRRGAKIAVGVVSLRRALPDAVSTVELPAGARLPPEVLDRVRFGALTAAWAPAAPDPRPTIPAIPPTAPAVGSAGSRTELP